MKALERYTHEDRQKVIDRLVPEVQKEFGDNFLGFASMASFARSEDTHYSDLELAVFVKELPEPKKIFGIAKIIDGMLIELCCYTPEGYLADVKNMSKSWIIAGSNTLSPIVNEGLVEELNAHVVFDLQEKALKQALHQWPEVQEATGKVLNAVASENREGLLLLTADMIEQMLVSLSLLNCIPFVTFGRFISQGKTFEVKPKNWDVLVSMFNAGIPDPVMLAGLVDEVITDFERIFESRGCTLYDCRDPIDLVAGLKKLVDNQQSLN